jgi:hypothetical protein
LPLVVNAIVGLARVRAEQGEPERALELSYWASVQPALHHQTRIRRVDPLLQELGARLHERVSDAARERSRSLELEAIVRLALAPEHDYRDSPARAG